MISNLITNSKAGVLGPWAAVKGISLFGALETAVDFGAPNVDENTICTCKIPPSSEGGHSFQAASSIACQIENTYYPNEKFPQEVRMKQTNIIMHGMGEQIPMQTLNALVDAVWTTDQTLVDRNKPAPTTGEGARIMPPGPNRTDEPAPPSCAGSRPRRTGTETTPRHCQRKIISSPNRKFCI